eukprot:1440442-Pyramimonas_sp.AAC.1
MSPSISHFFRYCLGNLPLSASASAVLPTQDSSQGPRAIPLREAPTRHAGRPPARPWEAENGNYSHRPDRTNDESVRIRNEAPFSKK